MIYFSQSTISLPFLLIAYEGSESLFGRCRLHVNFLIAKCSPSALASEREGVRNTDNVRLKNMGMHMISRPPNFHKALCSGASPFLYFFLFSLLSFFLSNSVGLSMLSFFVSFMFLFSVQQILVGNCPAGQQNTTISRNMKYKRRFLISF